MAEQGKYSNSNSNRNGYFDGNPNIHSGTNLHRDQYPNMHGNNNMNNNSNQSQGYSPRQPNTYYPGPPKIISSLPPGVSIVPIISVAAQCPFCGYSTQTFVTRSSGCFVWIMCLLFFLFLCGLCCIPFCVDQWQDQQYRCKTCGQIKSVNKGTC